MTIVDEFTREGLAVDVAEGILSSRFVEVLSRLISSDESFNGRFRDECLNQDWFRHRLEPRAIVEAWRQRGNEVRPHSSLGYMTTPNEFLAALERQFSKSLEAVVRGPQPRRGKAASW